MSSPTYLSPRNGEPPINRADEHGHHRYRSSGIHSVMLNNNANLIAHSTNYFSINCLLFAEKDRVMPSARRERLTNAFSSGLYQCRDQVHLTCEYCLYFDPSRATRWAFEHFWMVFLTWSHTQAIAYGSCLQANLSEVRSKIFSTMLYKLVCYFMLTDRFRVRL